MSKSPKTIETAVTVESTVQGDAADSLMIQKRLVAADLTKNVSYRIRELAGLGSKMGEIVKLLTGAGYKTKNGTDIRFQHVRNVLLTPAKKS